MKAKILITGSGLSIEERAKRIVEIKKCQLKIADYDILSAPTNIRLYCPHCEKDIQLGDYDYS